MMLDLIGKDSIEEICSYLKIEDIVNLEQTCKKLNIEIFRCTCLQSHLQTSPPTPHIRVSELYEIPPCPPKYSIVRGVGEGGPQIYILVWNPNIFVS